MTTDSELRMAAKALTDAVFNEHFGTVHNKRVLVDCLLINNLASALASAPQGDEARVREAAHLAMATMHGTTVDRFTPYHDSIEAVMNALRPFILPAPTPPAGEVSVKVSVLREWQHSSKYLPNAISSQIDAILPAPAPPEPSAETEVAWEREAKVAFPTQDRIPHPDDRRATESYNAVFLRRDGYLAAKLADWRAAKGEE